MSFNRSCVNLEGATAYVGLNPCKDNWWNYFTCDGVDDNEEIQQALDLSSESGGATVIEAGEYTLSDTPVITGNYNTVVGMGKATRLISPAGKYALQIGDGTADKALFTTVENLRIKPSSRGDGNGFFVNYARGFRAKGLLIEGCNIGARLQYASQSLLDDLYVTDFTSKGLYYSTGPALITDQYVSNCSVTSGESGTVGIDVEESVNGIRLTNLIVGSDTTGIDVGIRFTGSYSGVWMDNVVVDQLVGTGIEFHDGATYPCRDIQMNNVWVQSCGGHGIWVEGHVDRMIERGQFSNLKINNNGKAGLVLKNAEYLSFVNSEFVNNANDNIQANDYMTNVLVEDKIGTTSFNHCWMIQGQNLSNRKRPMRIVTKNGSYSCVYLRDCFVKDYSGDESSRVGLYKTNAGEELYAYAINCAIKNGSIAPNDTFWVKESGSPQEPNVMDETGIKLNPALGW